MRKTSLNLAMLATLAAFTTVVHADTKAVQGSFSSTVTDTGIVYNFTGATWAGFFFSQLTGSGADTVYGTLTSVSVDATLDASGYYTWASDLTIYVTPLPLAAGGLLQVGGYSDTGATEQHSWANGDASAPGTTVIDTVALNTPITFTGSPSDVTIWLGNGYGSGDASTWTGSITLTGLSLTPLPVPEPANWALFAAGAVGLAGWMGRRRRQPPSAG
jgi:hypothetical protein